jgi:hypothetical protein
MQVLQNNHQVTYSPDFWVNSQKVYGCMFEMIPINEKIQKKKGILNKVHPGIVEELESQVWSPCIMEILLDRLPCRSEKIDAKATALFKLMKKYRELEGVLHHYQFKCKMQTFGVKK